VDGWVRRAKYRLSIVVVVVVVVVKHTSTYYTGTVEKFPPQTPSTGHPSTLTPPTSIGRYKRVHTHNDTITLTVVIQKYNPTPGYSDTLDGRARNGR